MALQQIQMQAASWEMHWLILRLHLLVTPQGLVFTPSMPVLYYTVPATNYNTTICNSLVFQLQDITQYVAIWHWFYEITSASARIVLIWLKKNVMNWFIHMCAMDKKNHSLYPAHMEPFLYIQNFTPSYPPSKMSDQTEGDIIGSQLICGCYLFFNWPTVVFVLIIWRIKTCNRDASMILILMGISCWNTMLLAL